MRRGAVAALLEEDDEAAATIKDVYAQWPATVARLELWARVDARRQDHGLDLPRRAAFWQIGGGGGCDQPAHMLVVVDVGRALVALRQVDPLYVQVINEEFVRGGTWADKAKALGVRKVSFACLLRVAVRKVDEWFNEREYPEMRSRVSVNRRA